MKRSQRAFTLIEVLVALVILAIAMFAVMRATSRSIHVASLLKTRIAARWVAENVLSSFQVGFYTVPKEGLSQSGTASMMGMQFRWVALNKHSVPKAFDVLSINVGRLPKGGSDYQVEGFVNEA